MSKEEIKYEIGKVLDQFPTDALEELLQFLRQLDEKHSVNALYLQKILADDKELLQKLAQ